MVKGIEMKKRKEQRKKCNGKKHDLRSKVDGNDDDHVG